MKPVIQTKVGGPDVPPEERGDCFDACLASVFEVPITECHVPHTDNWWDDAQDVAHRHGYRLVYLGEGSEGKTLKVGDIADWLGPVFWLAGVRSLNLAPKADGTPVGHVVVMHGESIVHDPSLGRRRPLGPDRNLNLLDGVLPVELVPGSKR